MSEFVRAFLLIFIAEMGDKTQLIAMSFATKYSIKDVLKGVILGVTLNHGLAIILGSCISQYVAIEHIQLGAGLLFLVFGILGLLDDKEEEEELRQGFGPVCTVAIAFFIGEFGDKTQLAAMALGAESSRPILILMGTVLGMLGTSSLGMLVGSKMGEKISATTLKIIASIAFIFCGSLKLYSWLPAAYSKPLYIIIYLALIVIIELGLIIRLLHSEKAVNLNPGTNVK